MLLPVNRQNAERLERLTLVPKDLTPSLGPSMDRTVQSPIIGPYNFLTFLIFVAVVIQLDSNIF